MNSYITLQSPTKGADGMGGGKLTYVDVASLWAAVRPLNGKEYFEGQQLKANITHKVEIRYDNRVKSKCRFTYGARIFDIVGPPIDPDERGARMVCMCSEVER